MSKQTIHFFLQGKSGVGYSYVASHLAQFLQEKHSPQNCIFYDTDPVNKTFASIQALNVNVVDILKGNVIDIQKFDELLNILIAPKMQNKQVVIDSGASSFLPLLAYMKENGIVDFFAQHDIKTLFHVVLSGGQPWDETYSVLNFIKNLLGRDINVIVWLNPLNGEITSDNRILIQSYLDENINDFLIEIPLKNKDLFGRDIEKMTAQKLTYKQVAKSESQDFQMMTRRRLDMYKNEIFTQLAELEVL
jgi:hypothetical protein